MRIFLAGTYSETKHIDILKESPYLLESFYYVKDWQTDIFRNCKDFLLDSGAFTFMGRSNKELDWDQYIERYADFINKYDIKHFFELDIDKIVGYEQVKIFRKKLESLTGKRSIPVWHKSRGYDEYLKLCDKYDYVAIGGIAIKDIKRSEYKYFPKMLNDAHRLRCRVHGLGFTNVSLLPYFHFDSVDSTRWNCARFGRLEYFNGTTIKAIDRRKDGMKLVGRKNPDILRFNLEQWIKFQKYADSNL